MCSNSTCSCNCGKCTTSMVARWLLIVGGLNWGLVGLGTFVGGGMYSWNVVAMVLGGVPLLEAAVYLLVGAAAVLYIFGCRCNKCRSGVCENHTMADNKPGM